MGDLGPFAILALVWWLFSVVMEGRAKARRRQGGAGGGGAAPRPRSRPRPRIERQPPPASDPSRSLPAGGDPTQREGNRLEQILREFERALEESQERAGQPPSPVPGGWEGAEEVEERESLDGYEPEVASYERSDQFDRGERPLVGQDDDAEALVERRIAAAESRNRALSGADHARFDARIRQAPAVPELENPDGAARAARLRQAIVWREVLGPPVSLRVRERD